jgi:hypothetical protein
MHWSIISVDLLEAPEKYRTIWEELKTIHEARFRWGEKEYPSDFTSSTASSMQQDYPSDWVLSGPRLPREVIYPARRTIVNVGFSSISRQ